MTAAPQHPDLHELVDQLSPAQADAVHAVIIQFVAPGGNRTSDHEVEDTSSTPPRTLAFVGAGASAAGITTGMDEALADGFGRD